MFVDIVRNSIIHIKKEISFGTKIILDAALHNIEVQGDFITEMISVNPVR